MPKSHAKPTTTANLEAKFDAGEDVLDYFDLSTAKLRVPIKRPAAKTPNQLPATRARLEKMALKIAGQIRKLETELGSLIGKKNVKPGSFVLPQHR
jgi:hypothetical protein